MTSNKNTIFITGIDTDIGKTFVTGLLAKYIKDNVSKDVVTMKMVQSGINDLTEISSDILLHREIMNEEPNHFDIKKRTCPYSFRLPASPHLAAKLENKEIDSEQIKTSINMLNFLYKYTFVEGIGGLLVPLNNNLTVIDFIHLNNYPIILVSSPKLGSINHTLLSLEALANRGIEILALVYKETEKIKNDDKIIYNDTLKIFRKYLDKYGYDETKIIEIPFFDVKDKKEVEDIAKRFSILFD